ncbi:DeoR/GlpR family DNA-binding transcription regulator [Oceanobacillus sojae]|uniref:DeoR/GlpR family DNA-binding transcription regulator n=1 Tax=Oceanobacillus sojae TaxID=582851 RepID=UPI0021A3E54C|nr:DeoR/GlpR family DNA-binding transcription regulator [Oceanobacillus sojae]MCT1901492.1 DeoR/GlpR family DNA-binding transcription regulator [Oceanobacillus sojae]
MLQTERHEIIMEKILKEQSIRTIDLCDLLNVSRQTIRNDLEYLDSIGKLKKVHGGAILEKKSIEPSFETRSNNNLIEKKAIAEKAVQMIEDGDTIYLDIGTTVGEMIPHLNNFYNLTVITNSINFAYQLSQYENIRVICSGGEMRNSEKSLSGHIARKILENYYVDKSFIGIGGISEKAGYTDYYIDEAEIRKLMINHSNTSYALLDYSKVGVIAIAKYADLSDIGTVITDCKTSKNIIDSLQSHGVDVITVE